MCGKGSSGGGGFGSLAPIQQSTTQASPQAIQAYTKSLGLADVAVAQPFQQYSTDPNAFVAPLTGTQQQAIGGLYGAQGAYQPYYQGAGQLTASAGTTAAPQLAGQYMNPFMQQVINPVLQQQGQQLAQQQAEAIRGGAFGGERAGLQRQALRGQQGLATGQLYAGGYNQALQAAQGDLARQLQAGQALGALGTGAQTAALQAPQALLGAGTLEQQTQQAGLTALYNQFLQGRAYPYQQAQFYSNIAGGLGPLLGQTTYQSQAQNPFGMFLSEPGAKTGVDGYADGGVPQDRSQPDVVGKTFDDQNIYAYRYKDGGPAHLGLMADEVQQAHPEAVGYAPTGDRMVDYAAATDAAARMGGAVKDTGDYARGGYAIGGHLSYVDPSDPGASDRRRMEALLASHKGGLSGAASEYGPSGESYVTQKTYVPAGTVRAGQQLQHASFSPMQRQSGIGSALEMGEKLGGLLSKGYDAYNKYQDYKTLKSMPQESSQPYELNKYDRGGIVPTSYLPEEITGEVRASQPLRPAEISDKGQDKESGLSKLMSVGEKALDAGIKYGPLLAKGATMLASLSEPHAKTGVRSGYAEGGESNFIDNLINALSGHGYITGETWERPQREAATREPMELHPAARSKGVVPSISPEQYRYERRMAERNMAPSLTEEQYQQELEMGRNNMRTERPMIAGSRGIVPSNRFTPDLDRELAMGRHNMDYPTLAQELAMGRRNLEYPTLAEELEMGRRNMAPSLTEEEADRELAMGRQNMMSHGGRTGYATVGGVRPANDDVFERGILGAESGHRQFDEEGRTLRSPKGAAGIAQVMPGTAPEAARLAGLPYNEQRYLTDPEYNEALGRAYYNKQLETFGSKDKAAAAYNAGPGALRNALRRAEREGGDYLSYLPAETRAYVPKVLGLAGARGEEGVPRITPEAVTRAREGFRLDRMAGSFTPEQRSMMAMDESSREGLGAAKQKEEGGLGDYLTSEEFLIPALTGLGTAATTMIGAPTRNLGSAIGLGLGAGTVAGAQQVLATKAKQAEIEKARQEAGKIGRESELLQAEELALRAGIGSKAPIRDEQGRLGYNVYIGDSRTPVFVTVNEFMQATRAAEAEGKPSPYRFSPVPSSEVGAGAAPTQLPGGGAAAAGREETTAPTVKAPGVEAPAYAQLPPDITKLVKKNAMGVQSSGYKTLENDPIANPFRDQEMSAREAQATIQQRNALTKSLNELARSGRLTQSGKFSAAIATPIVSWVGSALDAIGVPKEFTNTIRSPQDLGSAEVQEKIRTFMAAKRTQAGGQHSFAGLEAFLAATPSQMNTPQGAANLLADIYTAEQREIDIDRYYRKAREYAVDKLGLSPIEAEHIGQGLRDEYVKRMEPEYAKEKKAIAEMFLESNIPIKDPETGAMRKVPALSYIAEQGGRIPPELAQKIDKAHGTVNLMRYFSGS